jgi:hypothetical protein
MQGRYNKPQAEVHQGAIATGTYRKEGEEEEESRNR